jgi:hypothetical protein
MSKETLAKKTPEGCVRCSCGADIKIPRLKTHLQQSLNHWDAKSMGRNNGKTPEELDAEMKKIISAASLKSP